MNMRDRVIGYIKAPAKNRIQDDAHLVHPSGGDAAYLTGPQSRRLGKKIRRETAHYQQEIEALAPTLDEAVLDLSPEQAADEHTALSQEIETKAPESYTRDELRALASDAGIKGRGAMNKAQLIEALTANGNFASN